MQLFHETLLTTETSNEVSMLRSGTVQFMITGTTAGEAFDVQMAHGPGASFIDYIPSPDTNVLSLDTAGKVETLVVTGGQRFQLVGDGGGDGTTDVDCYVGGDVIDAIENAS